ncbi:tRNA pseudouridine synthase A, mitochondrial [Porphyridium purpureum]|uniref:tRNA pseudouridine synthase A, mitochondrial n=1 Tax=Porphyridium purpureum TaxID=35688 RepID=A0A5J4YX20_PORPP|nr:tRNA pseudouridine synthase A, mitochondrial [Porphyridium purpureum]|eukprot:POR7388..scf209_3
MGLIQSLLGKRHHAASAPSSGEDLLALSTRAYEQEIDDSVRAKRARVDSVTKEEVGDARAPAKGDDDQAISITSVAKRRKKGRAKVALMLGYLGEKYHGFQIQAAELITVEKVLVDALRQLGELPEVRGSGMMDFALEWSRAARTDRGVSAAAQVVAFRTPFKFSDSYADFLVNHLNRVLPDDIHVYGCREVTHLFCARVSCTKRKYEYLLPVHVLLPSAADMSMGQIAEHLPARIEYLNKILALYEGSHPFHKFTERMSVEDSSGVRYIISVACDPEPICFHDSGFRPSADSLLRIRLIGQSFILHQIRNMVGLAVLVARDEAPIEAIRVALRTETNITVPKAPALGLLLDEPFFELYNKKRPNVLPAIDFADFHHDKEHFKRGKIYPYMYWNEKATKNMFQWLKGVSGKLKYDRDHILWQFETIVMNPDAASNRKEIRRKARVMSYTPSVQSPHALCFGGDGALESKRIFTNDPDFSVWGENLLNHVAVVQLRFQLEFDAPPKYVLRVPGSVCALGSLMHSTLGFDSVGFATGQHVLAALSRAVEAVTSTDVRVATGDSVHDGSPGRTKHGPAEIAMDLDLFRGSATLVRENGAPASGAISELAWLAWRKFNLLHGMRVADVRQGRMVVESNVCECNVSHLGSCPIAKILGMDFSFQLLIGLAYAVMNDWFLPRLDAARILMPRNDLAHHGLTTFCLEGAFGQGAMFSRYGTSAVGSPLSLLSGKRWDSKYCFLLTNLEGCIAPVPGKNSLADLVQSMLISTLKPMGCLIACILMEHLNLGVWRNQNVMLGEVLKTLLYKGKKATTSDDGCSGAKVYESLLSKVLAVIPAHAQLSPRQIADEWNLGMSAAELITYFGLAGVDHATTEAAPLPLGKFLVHSCRFFSALDKWCTDEQGRLPAFFDLMNTEYAIFEQFGANEAARGTMTVINELRSHIQSEFCNVRVPCSTLTFNAEMTSAGLLTAVSSADCATVQECICRWFENEPSLTAGDARPFHVIPEMAVIRPLGGAAYMEIA